MESYASRILDFYSYLGPGPEVPSGVAVLRPHEDSRTRSVMDSFYHKYYEDTHRRVFLVGINPGRLGAGVTGIPFTDPIRLAEVCGIANDFDRKAELSSKFIYQLIEAYGGPEGFYSQFYFTSVSPLGFTRAGKNLNYYDLKELQEGWEDFMVASLKKQIAFGAHPVAFTLGQGKNHQYLYQLNEKHQLFDEVKPLPHPRWVMQYRLKRLPEFIELYLSQLTSM